MLNRFYLFVFLTIGISSFGRGGPVYEEITTPTLLISESDNGIVDAKPVSKEQLFRLVDNASKLRLEALSDWPLIQKELAGKVAALEKTEVTDPSQLIEELVCVVNNIEYKFRLEGKWPDTGRLIWDKITSDVKSRVEFDLKQAVPYNISIDKPEAKQKTQFLFTECCVRQIMDFKNDAFTQIEYDQNLKLKSLFQIHVPKEKFWGNIKFRNQK